ncbi:MAG: hypothetical protein IPG04_16715 [Polyangiaceae bacterium]|nr:hypothetical protein [Polyangiaceae bacterium]
MSIPLEEGERVLASSCGDRLRLTADPGGVGLVRRDGAHRRIHEGLPASCGVFGPAGAFALWIPSTRRPLTPVLGSTEARYADEGIGAASLRYPAPSVPSIGYETSLALGLDHLLVVGTRYGEVHAYDCQRGELIGLLGRHTAAVTHVGATEDSRFVVSADARGYLQAYELVWDSPGYGERISRERLANLADAYMASLPGEEFVPAELLAFLSMAGCGDTTMERIAEASHWVASLRKPSEHEER